MGAIETRDMQHYYVPLATHLDWNWLGMFMVGPVELLDRGGPEV